MNGKRFSEKKSRKNGFYLALAVCLVAVGIAAWSTYDAVHSYVAPQGESSSAQQNDDNKPESDINTEDPTALKKSAATPKPAKQTNGVVTSKTEEKKTESEKPQITPVPTEEPESEVTAEPEQVPATAPLYEISEEMMYPVAGEQVMKAYSAGAPVYSQTMKDWRIHCGTDLAAEPDEQVCACANGIVKSAYTDSMLGNVMIIEHGDYEFYYCGLGENFLAAEGDIVTKGQAIGNVTAVPEESAEQAHLHIEVKRDGVYLNPEEVLSGRE